jgi:hypothetical protein
MVGSLLLTVGLFVGVETATRDAAQLKTFDSYTQAWQTARDESRPMLVVLNPAADSPKASKAVDVDGLRKDKAINELLDNYVVAQIDTSTEHGKKVMDVFHSPTLPRIVVIDAHQERQVFATSSTVSDTQLKTVLEKAKSGDSSKLINLEVFPKPDCPMCRLKAMGLVK